VNRALKAFPALLKVGFAEGLAYRAEFVIWMLSTTLPLVNLALWSTVASEQPDGQFGRFTQAAFVAYFLAALVVRNLVSSWVVWEMNQEIRMGTLSMRLLRPIHPFVAYAAEHIAAIPLRGLVGLPVFLLMLFLLGGEHVQRDPLLLALMIPALMGAWLITFLASLAIGTLGLFMERSTAVFEVWLGLFAVLSGYLVPLELMPRWLSTFSSWSPFRYMLGSSVENLVGKLTLDQVLADLAMQWTWVGILLVVVALVWRAGVRRFEAYGG
jgi:ABC-2 type transport system permease protein